MEDLEELAGDSCDHEVTVGGLAGSSMLRAWGVDFAGELAGVMVWG